MIANFPDLHEGELFYSVLARFAERMAYPALGNALVEFFGNRHGIAAVELPNKIDQLVSQLPPGTLYTTEGIIQKNTLLSLYAPFLPERNYELILQNMKGNGIRTTQLRAGIIAGRVSPPDFFRTCPVCDQENLKLHGETYWHRLHQISGVEVCPRHCVFLETTNVRLPGSARRHALITAQSTERASVGRVLDQNIATNQVFLQIAKSAAWLLEKDSLRPGLVAVNRGYRHLLASNGFISPQGWIRIKRLHERLVERCKPDLLKQFGCEVRAAGDGGWVGRMLRETEQATAPLCHLLVMAALNISAEDFFTHLIPEAVANRQQSFPCLNLVCPQFRTNVIASFELKRGKCGFARIFTCPQCGHRSSRPADGQKVIRVIEFGKLWEQRLIAVWGDASLSMRRISEDLEADERSLIKYAIKLGLPFPRRGPTRRTNRPGWVRVAKRTLPFVSLATKRETWNKLRHAHPAAGVGELHHRAPALYTWLYRHDREWMKQNSPERRPFVPKNDRVDWKVRDAELRDQVVAIAGRIKNKTGRLRRITVRAIGIELGNPTILQVYKEQLPRTRLALAAHVETTEQFALRRIRWAVDQFSQQHLKPHRSELMRVAGIGPTTRNIGSVEQAITEAKARLDIAEALSSA